MRSVILLGAAVFSASTCLAQTAPPQDQPLEQPAAAQQGPANLCDELLAFVTEAEAEAGPQANPAADARQSSSSSQNQDGSTALAGTAASDEDASAKQDSENSSAQEVTGQDGVATDAPDPDGKQASASGSVENAPQKDSRAAPTPPSDVLSVAPESILTMEEAGRLAAANDMEQCQKVAREMRVAGVDMPPPLIALAALDLQYHQQSGAGGETADPATPAADE